MEKGPGAATPEARGEWLGFACVIFKGIGSIYGQQVVKIAFEHPADLVQIADPDLIGQLVVDLVDRSLSDPGRLRKLRLSPPPFAKTCGK